MEWIFFANKERQKFSEIVGQDKSPPFTGGLESVDAGQFTLVYISS